MSFLNNFNKFRYFKKLNLRKIFVPKKLMFGFSSSGGRNNRGRICVFHRGGGHKRILKFLDFQRDFLFFWNIPALVISILYDSTRSANVALILYANGFFSYILCCKNLICGSKVILGLSKNFFEGDRMPAKFLPFGMKIHNVFFWSRAAGCFSKYLGPLSKKSCIISLPSGLKKIVSNDSLVTLGIVGNETFYRFKKYKAGQNRWLAKRPHVRGVAKNPIDHPMGGGQGKTSGGRVSVTPWGIYTKGYKTKRKKFLKERIKF